MPKVHCSLPNASNNINGVKFEPAENGVVSEEVDQATADAFAAIEGYVIVEPAKPAKVEKPATAPVKAEASAKGGKKAAEKPATTAAVDKPADAPAGDEKPAEDGEQKPADGEGSDAGPGAGDDGADSVF